MKRFLFALVGLTAIASTAFATPYYGFVGFGYGLSNNIHPLNQDSSVMVNPADGQIDATGTQEQYVLDSTHAHNYIIGAGYKLKPFFASGLIVSNAVEVSLEYVNSSYNGVRTEMLDSSYPSSLAFNNATSFSIYQKHVNLIGNYVLNFKPLSKTLSWYVKAGFGLSHYKYTNSEHVAAASDIAEEKFAKKGINALVDADIGLRYHITKRYSLSMGYRIQHYLRKETVHPTWVQNTNNSDIPASAFAAGQNSVSISGKQTTSQLYLRFAVQI